MGSSLPSGAAESLQNAFDVTSTLQTPLPVSVFLTGYILGPLVFAPMSEFYGRQIVFLTSFALYTIFMLGCTFAPNWPAFLVFRFFMGCGAAAPQTVSGGLFADLYADLVPRGRAMTLLGLTSNVGPLIGPILSGFTSEQDWRWQFYVALILVGVNWPLLLVVPGKLARSKLYNWYSGTDQGRNLPASNKSEVDSTEQEPTHTRICFQQYQIRIPWSASQPKPDSASSATPTI